MFLIFSQKQISKKSLIVKSQITQFRKGPRFYQKRNIFNIPQIYVANIYFSKINSCLNQKATYPKTIPNHIENLDFSKTCPTLHVKITSFQNDSIFKINLFENEPFFQHIPFLKKQILLENIIVVKPPILFLEIFLGQN